MNSCRHVEDSCETDHYYLVIHFPDATERVSIELGAGRTINLRVERRSRSIGTHACRRSTNPIAPDERTLLLERTRVEVVAALQEARRAELAMQTAARGLEAAEESYRVREALFASGKATSVELLDAQTDLVRARLEALNSHIDARVARVRLDYAVGGAMRESGPNG